MGINLPSFSGKTLSTLPLAFAAVSASVFAQMDGPQLEDTNIPLIEKAKPNYSQVVQENKDKVHNFCNTVHELNEQIKQKTIPAQDGYEKFIVLSRELYRSLVVADRPIFANVNLSHFNSRALLGLLNNELYQYGILITQWSSQPPESGGLTLEIMEFSARVGTIPPKFYKFSEQFFGDVNIKRIDVVPSQAILHTTAARVDSNLSFFKMRDDFILILEHIDPKLDTRIKVFLLHLELGTYAANISDERGSNKLRPAKYITDEDQEITFNFMRGLNFALKTPNYLAAEDKVLLKTIAILNDLKTPESRHLLDLIVEESKKLGVKYPEKAEAAEIKQILIESIEKDYLISCSLLSHVQVSLKIELEKIFQKQTIDTQTKEQLTTP